MISLSELLRARGLDFTSRVKIVRHFDKDWDVYALERENQLRYYQGYQSKLIFRRCDHIVVFLGMERGRARFQGVYRVGQEFAQGTYPAPSDLRHARLARPHRYFYELERLAGYEDLEGRVVIAWGRGALAWHQWYQDREVTEVLPPGLVRPLPGHLDFVLTYQALQSIMRNADAHPDWQQALRAVSAVYLILETRTGKQYVGSATGQGGVWARWQAYADTGHCGNLKLREEVDAAPGCVDSFQFTILQTWSASLTRDEIVAHEQLHKRKLGSRAFGLNAN